MDSDLTDDWRTLKHEIAKVTESIFRLMDVPSISALKDQLGIPTDTIENETVETNEAIGTGELSHQFVLNNRKTAPIPFRSHFRMFKKFVLLGGPGSGKSTLVKWLAWIFCQDSTIAQKELGIEEALFPIVVSVGGYGAERQHEPALDFGSYIEAILNKKGGRGLTTAYKRAIQDGTALILVDGLDEIPNEGQRVRASRWSSPRIRTGH